MLKIPEARLTVGLGTSPEEERRPRTVAGMRAGFGERACMLVDEDTRDEERPVHPAPTDLVEDGEGALVRRDGRRRMPASEKGEED
jgi:hypothetical protein